MVRIIAIGVVLLLLTGCFNHGDVSKKSDMEPTHADSTSTEQKKEAKDANAPQEKLFDWLLFRGENDNEMIHYVKKAGDEESFVYIDGFTSFFMKDNKDMPQDGISYVGGISQDGKKILLLNLSHQRHSISAQIYNFLSHQIELQFQLPHKDYALSPDLNQYLFEENGDIYLFRAKENEKTKLSLVKRDMYSIAVWKISPDGSKLCFSDDEANLVLFDIANNKIIKKINVGSKEVHIHQWFAEDKLIYTADRDTTYLLTIESEELKPLGQSMLSPVISPDGLMLVYADQDRNIFQLNMQTQQKTKLEDGFQRIGFESAPLQWIRSSTPFIDVKKSIPVKRVTASSTLPDENKISYNANQLTDGNTKTGWCEGTKGDGIGETVTLDFGTLQEVSGIDLINGLAQSLHTFKANNRVKSLKAEFSDGSSEVLDASFIQMNFSKKIKTSFIKLTILEVEKGDKYSDTCMSEVRVF
ncbi:NADase-type glycan-binding domain-containing protein [Paenibacillus ehimensis]|uniref:Discoidin domain-containing protein n=1 Tax=Paenibacillus ehimensis TaxID=79264 RepID=A0ABT8V2R6_9BACL|nr:discoidin domain-containing protein [Paenibacillus ehimensis]MDO3675717.1 discoidin domain-containing protein [Paenibacillus ehimensis]